MDQLFTLLTMRPARSDNLGMLGFGAQPGDISIAANHKAVHVPAGASKRIFWKCNLSGLLNNPKWIPLYALSGMGLQVIFTLAPVAETLIKKVGLVDYSQSYRLTDVKSLGSMMLLSDEIQDSFNSSLLSGTALRIPIKKLSSFWSYLSNTAAASVFDIPISRNFTRLASLYCSFVQEHPDGTGELNIANQFYVDPLSSESLTVSLHLGTKALYDVPVVGFKECWHRLLSTIGIQGSLSHASGIRYADYSTNSFAVAADCKQIPHLASSGINLSNTSVIFLKFAGFGTTTASLPSRAHIILQHDCIIECLDTSVSIYE